MTTRTGNGRAAHAALLLEEQAEVWRLLLGCFRAGDATWAEVEEARQEVDGAWDRYARAAGLPTLPRRAHEEMAR